MVDHQSEAHKWRAQSLRLLFPHPQDVQPGHLVQIQGIPPNNLAQIYTNVGAFFLSGAAALLLRHIEELEEEVVCRADLSDITLQAVNLYARVQTQGASFTWESSDLLLGRSFSIDSPVMKPDRFHRLDDEDDHTHDGELVSIVLSPTVVISGDQDGIICRMAEFWPKHRSTLATSQQAWSRKRTINNSPQTRPDTFVRKIGNIGVRTKL